VRATMKHEPCFSLASPCRGQKAPQCTVALAIIPLANLRHAMDRAVLDIYVAHPAMLPPKDYRVDGWDLLPI
jgi:hypothetical protein